MNTKSKLALAAGAAVLLIAGTAAAATAAGCCKDDCCDEMAAPHAPAPAPSNQPLLGAGCDCGPRRLALGSRRPSASIGKSRFAAGWIAAG